MARKNKVIELRRKSRLDALKLLQKPEGLPLPPRKAMAQAKKAGKKLGYPVPPYPNSNPIQLYQLFKWAREEWNKLGRWQSLAAPVAALVALTTWEKELTIQKEYYIQLAEEKARQVAASDNPVEAPKQRRKLFGIVPLPGR